jgi:hypothetical protein
MDTFVCSPVTTRVGLKYMYIGLVVGVGWVVWVVGNGWAIKRYLIK